MARIWWRGCGGGFPHRLLAAAPAQEDWGWYIEASFEGQSYLVGISGYPTPDATDPNHGEWRVIVEPYRSVWDRLHGKRVPAADEAFHSLLTALIADKPSLRTVRHESVP